MFRFSFQLFRAGVFVVIVEFCSEKNKRVGLLIFRLHVPDTQHHGEARQLNWALLLMEGHCLFIGFNFNDTINPIYFIHTISLFNPDI